MPKIKKVHRRKRYQAQINRKRLRNRIEKVPTIACKNIKKAWDSKKSTKTNLKEMGLAYDPNQIVPIPNVKQEIIKKELVKVIDPEEFEELHAEKEEEMELPKKFVAESLEEEALAPREKLFRLPKGQVQFLTYLMDKYGEDYEAMMRDPQNHYQLTWKQIRAKINKFKKIPAQYNAYLESKGKK